MGLSGLNSGVNKAGFLCGGSKRESIFLPLLASKDCPHSLADWWLPSIFKATHGGPVFLMLYDSDLGSDSPSASDTAFKEPLTTLDPPG